MVRAPARRREALSTVQVQKLIYRGMKSLYTASSVAGKREPNPDNETTYLSWVNPLKVLGDMQHALCHIILVQVRATCKAPEDSQGGCCTSVGLDGNAHMPQHQRPDAGSCL